MNDIKKRKQEIRNSIIDLKIEIDILKSSIKYFEEELEFVRTEEDLKNFLEENDLERGLEIIQIWG